MCDDTNVSINMLGAYMDMCACHTYIYIYIYVCVHIQV